MLARAGDSRTLPTGRAGHSEYNVEQLLTQVAVGAYVHTHRYCFIMFNVGDLTGRSLASSFKWPTINNPKLMWLPVLLRTAFIPLFMFCNVQFGGGEINYVPRFVQLAFSPSPTPRAQLAPVFII